MQATNRFLLRGISLSEVLDGYRNGAFLEVPLSKTALRLTGGNLVVASNYGSDELAPLFSFRDRSNIPVVLATTNCQRFEALCKNGSLPRGGTCEVCGRTFEGEACGVPIGREERTFLVDGQLRKKTIFWMDDSLLHCEESCALVTLAREACLPPINRDDLFENSETWLRLLYCYKHGNKPLRRAPDPRLLDRRGGPLPLERYKEGNYMRTSRFVPLPSPLPTPLDSSSPPFLSLPAKVTYVQCP